MGSTRPIDLSCIRYAVIPEARCSLWSPAYVRGVTRTSTTVAAVGEQFKNVHSFSNTAVEWRYEFTAKSLVPLVLRSSLPLLPGYSLSVANGINSRGWIVGQMETFEGGYAEKHDETSRIRPAMGSEASRDAILWWHGKVYALNTLLPNGSGWNLQQATAINSHGQIVGEGLYHGSQSAFLLTPKWSGNEHASGFG